jgi:thiol-disulfide isomerase/thioredoxin
MKKLIIAIFLFAHSTYALNFDSLKSADGKNFEAKSEYTLLYFWASWCPDCKEKLKGPLKEVAGVPNISFTTVNTDKDEALAKDFLAREKIEVPVAFDANKEIRKSLKVFAVPQWTLLKKEKNDWIVVKTDTDFDLAKIKALMK